MAGAGLPPAPGGVTICAVITLYSYPELFGVADNNPYGLKTFAFLKLSRLPFQHEHIFDAKAAPRAQLPYLKDDDHEVGDSDAIVAYLTHKYALTLDSKLTPAQRTTEHFIRRTLDDVYWVMSYSRWSDAVLSFLRDVSEPYLRVFRRFIPPLGAFDLSPMIAIIVLYFVQSLLVSVIRG